MEFIMLLTFACAFGGLLLALRVERRVAKMFGSGNLKDALWQFFSGVPDGEGNEVPPQAAFYAFCSGIAGDCTDRVLHDLPGALASLGGKNAAKKAAKTSAFARGAQELSAGGFGELAGIKDMMGGMLSKVGTGGEKGDWMSQIAPIFIEKMMNSPPGNGNTGLQSQPPQLQSGNYQIGGKMGGQYHG